MPFWLKPIEAQVPQVLLHILAHFHLIFFASVGAADGELVKIRERFR